jgi:tRNA A37 threonylcarbamoyladenosine dehydratase
LNVTDQPALAEVQQVFERRFGGIRRLYGSVGAEAVFASHVVIVGIGGVGSWTAEAVARSGVGRITLIDMDHVSESNTNRQIHALEGTYGMAKVEAMRDRLLQINPGVQVQVVDDFVTPHNWSAMAQPWLSGTPLAVVDACDQVQAKTAMAAWALAHPARFVTVGAAGGKKAADRVEIADLSETTHDPLLASLRYRLRKQHGAARSGRIRVPCVFSREPVAPPANNIGDACQLEGSADSSLNCHGYGSSVAVTAVFGMTAAGCVLNQIAAKG